MKLIYFLKPVGMDGPIKIGCSRHPAHRILSIAPWVPFPLEILATIPGGFDLERNIHECFAKSHSHSEWFHASPRLAKLVKDLAAGVSIHQALDLAAREGPLPHGKKGSKLPASTRLRMSYSHRIRLTEERLSKAGMAAFRAPADVHDIMGEWGGRENQGPSADEAAILDRYLADPEKYSVVPSWKREAA